MPSTNVTLHFNNEDTAAQFNNWFINAGFEKFTQDYMRVNPGNDHPHMSSWGGKARDNNYYIAIETTIV